jgi:hypothetical protein
LKVSGFKVKSIFSPTKSNVFCDKTVNGTKKHTIIINLFINGK